MTVPAVKGMVLPLPKQDVIQFLFETFFCLTRSNISGSVQSCDQSSNNTSRQNVTVDCTARLWNWRFSGLNSALRRAILTEDFRVFQQLIQANVGQASQIRARQFAFTFSPIHCSLMSCHSTPYVLRLKYFVKETINNFQSVITAAYPQKQEETSRTQHHKEVCRKWRLKSSAILRRVDWWRLTNVSKGRWVSIFTGNQPQESTRKCVYSTPLPCITYLKLCEKYVLQPRQRCRTITDRILREWGGRNCWPSSLSALSEGC